MNKDILLLGANAPDMELLRARLVRIGYRVVPAKTPEQAHSFLRIAGTRIGAVIVPSEMPVMNLRAALDFMRRLSPTVPLTFLGAGREPGAEGRQRFRSAGIQTPIFDPLDLHTLRFQVNRALATGRPMHRHRTTLRAPADWPVLARSGVRQKEGRIYSISASGAYLSIAQPWMVKSRVELRLAIPNGDSVTASGRVVMTNVPGNVMKRNLPFGMGVHFDHVSEQSSIALLIYAEERSRALCL
jgi:CheY-like chemotaxis protein